MKKSDVKRIIKEEMDRMAEMAMDPAERSARRRAQAKAREAARFEAEQARRALFEPRRIGSAGSLAGALSSPDTMGYQQYTGRRKAAFIEPRFQKAEGIYTAEDAAAAVRDGRAKIWTAGVIGGGAPSAYTIVPADAEKSYNAATGEAGYPYAYSEYAKDPATGKTNWEGGIEVAVYTGAGSYGSLGGPRVWPPKGSEYILDNVTAYFSEIVPLPLLTMKKEEAEEAAEEMSGEMGDVPMSEIPGGGEENLQETRWAKMAGLLED